MCYCQAEGGTSQKSLQPSKPGIRSGRCRKFGAASEQTSASDDSSHVYRVYRLPQFRSTEVPYEVRSRYEDEELTTSSLVEGLCQHGQSKIVE